jgi:hypothetical protein
MELGVGAALRRPGAVAAANSCCQWLPRPWVCIEVHMLGNTWNAYGIRGGSREARHAALGASTEAPQAHLPLVITHLALSRHACMP